MANGDPEIQEIPDNLNDFDNQVRQYILAPGIESEMMKKVEQCFNNDGNVFEDIISNNLHNNKEWMRIAVIKIPLILKYTFFDNIGKNYQFDYKSAVMACAIAPGCFGYIESAVSSHYSAEFHHQFITDVLRLNGLSIEELHQDENYEEYLRIALAQNGYALKYTSASIKDKPEFVNFALDRYIKAYEFASDRIKEDRNLALKVVQKDGMCIKFVCEKFRNNDKKMILAAVSNNGLALSLVPAGWRKNQEILKAAIAQNPSAIQYIPKKLRKLYE